jgi:hypothetical protein
VDHTYSIHNITLLSNWNFCQCKRNWICPRDYLKLFCAKCYSFPNILWTIVTGRYMSIWTACDSEKVFIVSGLHWIGNLVFGFKIDRNLSSLAILLLYIRSIKIRHLRCKTNHQWHSQIKQYWELSSHLPRLGYLIEILMIKN